MSARFFVAVAGITVGVFSWLGMAGGGRSFGPWTTVPVVTVLPLLFASMLVQGNMTGQWLLFHIGPAVIGPALFFGWNLQLLRGVETVPRRSWVGLICLTVLTLLYFVGSWGAGIEYRGRPRTMTLALANGAGLVLCWGALLVAQRSPSFGRSLLFHWIAAVWLVWVAFPWLGESI